MCNKPRVIVEVSGGVVVGVYSSVEINVDVLDHDNWVDCDEGSQESIYYAELDKELEKLQYIN